MTTDAERLARARQVVRRGARERHANAAYAAYVAVLFGGVYGLPAGQQLARSLDPTWLTRHLTTGGAVALGVLAVGALLGLAWLAGSVRGPVVPELAYVDLVLSSGLGRQVALRPWWLLSLAGCLFGGALGGLVVGASIAFVELAGWLILIPAVVAGAALGGAMAWAWRAGQLRGSPPIPAWTAGAASPSAPVLRGLDRLTLTQVRRQSAAAVVLGGAALAGDLRAARLELAPPSVRARTVALRPGRPVPVLLRRDLLGWRRAPWAVARGLLSTAVGAALVDLARQGGDAPIVFAVAGGWLLHSGFAAWCEGLRLQGDTGGTAELLGLSARTQTLAHLVLPALGYLGAAGVVGAALVAAGGIPAAFWWAGALLPVVAGANLAAAFRGAPPMTVFTPDTGIPTLLLWLAWPHLLTVVCAGWLTALARDGAGPWWLPVGAAMLAWGLQRQSRLTLAHRV